jgi:hypothetical protein
MKKLLILMAITSLSVRVSAQDSNWESKIADKFYSKISGDRRFDCCDNGSKVKQMRVTIDLPDERYPRMDFNLKHYVEESIDSVIIDHIVCILEKTYLRKFSARKRRSLKKSCYSMYLLESVTEDLYRDVVFVSGQIIVIVNFQTK